MILIISMITNPISLESEYKQNKIKKLITEITKRESFDPILVFG